MAVLASGWYHCLVGLIYGWAGLPLEWFCMSGSTTLPKSFSVAVLPVERVFIPGSASTQMVFMSVGTTFRMGFYVWQYYPSDELCLAVLYFGWFVGTPELHFEWVSMSDTALRMDFSLATLPVDCVSTSDSTTIRMVAMSTGNTLWMGFNVWQYYASNGFPFLARLPSSMNYMFGSITL
ncbi:hypothetical protein KIN20_002826 [Parelaphostrongylus tenuis]|uniref:Uncharacterized protein n=1 Tax=Parelaphostrongylus tenuis TaxID=148309 RepID=A0AAD5QD84_PARTN|nr:hypothetical protein KIN20_002826 [Parelaphostrongylus tenuis]